MNQEVYKVGSFGGAHGNERGQKLMNFWENEELVAINSFFNKKNLGESRHE